MPNRLRQLHDQPKRSRSATVFIAIAIVFILIVVFFNSLILFRSRDRYTVVWATDPVWVTTLDVQKGTVGLLRIPSEGFVSVPGGFGSYRIGVLWRLGMVEKKSGSILASASQSFFGAPIDGWVGKGNASISMTTTGVDALHQLADQFLDPRRSITTNISPLDRFLLWWQFRNVTPANTIVIDLEKEQVFTPELLGDDTEALRADVTLIDKISEKIFREEQLSAEPFVYRIYNASGILGMGNTAARILSNSGLHVVGIGNSDEKETCVLLLPQGQEQTKSIERVAGLFQCSIQSGQLSGKEIQLYLGKKTKVGGFL